MSAFVRTVLAALVALLFAGGARAQEARLFFARVELVGPLTSVELAPTRGGTAHFDVELVEGERLELALPVPLGGAVDLEFGGPPTIVAVGSGSASLLGFEPAPRLAGVPRAVLALPRPRGRDGRAPTPFAALATAAAALLLAGAASRRSRALSAACGVLGAAAVVAVVRLLPGGPAWVETRDSVHGADAPTAVVRWTRGVVELDGSWRGAIETDPPGADLRVRGRLGADGLRYEVGVAGGAGAAALLRLDTESPARPEPEDAVVRWRGADGRWFAPVPGSEPVPSAAPAGAWITGGLPQGRTARVAVLGERVWRVLDAPPP
ncbi:MAG: hypothetical protein R3F34_07590 [Planctomycetota bacterium]